MTENLLLLAGGIGLYILGMQMMTDALRQLASRQLREALRRFTTSPLSGAVTGAAATAVVQSSSAVLVTTIGFVGAGLLTFPQAIGIIYGANVGTTITGWMVVLLGVKLQLGTAALPMLLAAALLRALAGGPWARAGTLLAGFSLIFLGFDLMQQGTGAFESWLVFDRLPGDTLAGRLALLGIGMGVTLVIQSSSAGVAMALVLLTSGAISLPQAAAMVIGMDIGTTFKSLIATIGGSRDMRRTAMAHVAYNVVTGLAAFAVVGWAAPAMAVLTGGDAPAALVAFHTAFNLMGVMLMLPLTAPFARLIERLVPGRGPSLTQKLDPALLADPGAALDAAGGATDAIASALCTALGTRLGPSADPAPLEELAPLLSPALDDLESFLTRIRVAEGDAATLARRSAALHRFDHLQRLAHRAAQTDRIALLAKDPVLRRPAAAFGAALSRAANAPRDPATARKLARLEATLLHRAHRLRRSALLREHAGLVSPEGVFDLTDASRWLTRSAHHAERIAHYAQ